MRTVVVGVYRDKEAVKALSALGSSSIVTWMMCMQCSIAGYLPRVVDWRSFAHQFVAAAYRDVDHYRQFRMRASVSGS